MTQTTFAPWAERVIETDHLMTVDELLALPDDGNLYELLEGRLLLMPASGGGNSNRAVILIIALGAFVEAHGLGRVTGSDGEYVLSRPNEPDTSVAPDVAFVRSGHYPPVDSPEFERAWRLAPDLAVEIASPHQYRLGMAAKARLYLEAGTQLVWIVWPQRRQVDVWRAGSDVPVDVLGIDDVLDGEDIVPGFSFPVARLFA